MRVPRLASLAAGAAVVVLAACGGGGSGATGPKVLSGGTVSIRMLFDPGKLDPQLAASAAQEGFASYLYDSLVADVNGTIQPEIATRWKVTPQSATFTLRTDVTCDDGHKLTASDVASNYNRIKDPA